MKKFYYFSESKLNFIEIRNFNRKFFLVLSISVILISSVLFGGYLVIDNYFNPDSKIANLKDKNRELSKRLNSLLVLYKELNQDVDSLAKINEVLRIAANLEPISDDLRRLGTGGGDGVDYLSFFASEEGVDLAEIDAYMNKIEKLVEFEKNNYYEIAEQLRKNQLLYDAIPAIKPCQGELTAHGFGMRLHPIFKVYRMHEGVDIVTRTGTNVYASGAGTVVFAGRRGGLGIAVEIDHGFGYRTVYGHLSSIEVTYKQKVNRGQLIAKSGNTGISTGPHVHYEVHNNGVKLNPEEFFFDNLKIFENVNY